MKKAYSIIFIFLLLQSLHTSAQYSGILMDGSFTDWPASATKYADANGDASLVDIESMSLWNDSLNLYIRLKLDKEINLQETPINLYIDTDNNASTGLQFNGIGVDFAYFFGDRRGIFQGNTIYHNHVGHISLPTHTSSEFEISFSRNALPDDVNKLFPAPTIKLILREELENGDVIPDNGSISYTFQNNAQPKYQPLELTKADTNLLRLMNYNILRDRPMQPQYQDQFTRIMNALNPDIIAFNEFYNSSAQNVKTLMDNTLPNKNGWYAAKHGLDVVTLSRYPIKQSWEVLPGHNISAVLIDLPNRFEKDILVINAHFRCCAAGSVPRQQEADAIIAFLRDAKTAGGTIDLPENTPFILLGDLNLVTDKQQLLTLLNGDIQDNTSFGEDIQPDWDTTELEDLISYHTDAPQSYTWYDDRSDFAPGRLDYMIFSNSSMQAENAFTLETATMSPTRLAKYNLNTTDVRFSDHLPKVADFKLRQKQTIGLGEKLKPNDIKLYPNPVAETLYITLPENALEAKVKLIEITGKVISINKLYGKNLAVSLQGIPAGLYIIQLEINNEIYTQKLIKH